MTSAEPWTILRVLDWTRGYFQEKGVEGARLDAELIIADTLGMPRVMLYAHFDRPLVDAELGAIRAKVARRARREPVAYILGRREFWSLELEVSPAVLIPRPDTELLVERVAAALNAHPGPTIADVGTGSGAIALALATELPRATVEAIDASPEALAVAARNAARLGLESRVAFRVGDLLAEREGPPLDAIVANLPYIPSADVAGLMPEVARFEPRLALDGGDDGLALIRRLAADAPAHLVPGGLVALEAGHDQLDRVAAILTAAGFAEVEIRADLAGHPRVALARRG